MQTLILLPVLPPQAHSGVISSQGTGKTGGRSSGRLWGAIEAEEARGPVGQWEAERDSYSQVILAHAGPEFERGRQDGVRLSLNEVVDDALDEVR